MTSLKQTKASADALDDNQFILNAEEAKDQQQQDASPEDQPTKRKRKRNNKKNKTPVQPTSKPAILDNDENSHDDPSNEPPKKKKKSHKSNQPHNPKNAQAKPLKQNERNKAKAKLKRPKSRAASKESSSQGKEEIPSTPEESVNESSSIGLQPPDLQLNYLKDRQKRALPDLSDLELESFPLEKSWLQDVSDKPMRAHLGPWLKIGAVPGLLEALNETTEIPGAPVALVVTSAALRAANLCRELKPLVKKPKKSGQITKLFAKHFKLKEHIKHVNTTTISIGVGTPHRISTLLSTKNEIDEALEEKEEEEPLKLTRLKFIIFDLTWLDAKSYNLTELPDSILRISLWKSLLGFPELIQKFQSGQTKLVLF